MKSWIFYMVAFSTLFFIGCSNQRLMKMNGRSMTFRVMKNWSDTQADSVFSMYGMNGLNFEKLITSGNMGGLGKEGWYIRKNNFRRIVLRKELANEWANYEDIDQVLWGAEPETGNAFSSEIFGANIGNVSLFQELNDSVTRFFLNGYNTASEISISGTFNEWSTEGQKMIRNAEGWYADVHLKPGRHEYKFIQDGKWFYDKENDLKIEDGYYSYNNIYFKPNVTFEYQGSARQVVVAGSFNNWNEKDFVMTRNGDKHYLQCFVPDGEWQYRFIVDGYWISDPSNPKSVPNEYNETNSILRVGNFSPVEIIFIANGQQNDLRISGSFNSWPEDGVAMRRLNDSTWIYTTELRDGVYTYRFKSAGEWLTDTSKPSVNSSVRNQRDNVLVVGSNFTFELQGFENAQEVYVSGNFIGWKDPGLSMTKQNGVWKVDYFLKSGKMTYKFVVDGQWILDPGNEIYEDNEFGTGNSVLWMH